MSIDIDLIKFLPVPFHGFVAHFLSLHLPHPSQFSPLVMMSGYEFRPKWLSLLNEGGIVICQISVQLLKCLKFTKK